MRDRWKPSEFVKVINLDDEPFEWQWFPSTEETESFTDNGAVRVIEGRASFDSTFTMQYPGKEQKWVINPGASEVLLGENAYLFVGGLYKRLVSKKKIAESPNQEQTKARNFNWIDGKLQEDMIDKIFLGVVNPNFNDATTATAKSTRA